MVQTRLRLDLRVEGRSREALIDSFGPQDLHGYPLVISHMLRAPHRGGPPPRQGLLEAVRIEQKRGSRWGMVDVHATV